MRLAPILLLALLFAACGDAGPVPFDAGDGDAGLDAGPDGDGSDGGADGQLDGDAGDPGDAGLDGADEADGGDAAADGSDGFDGAGDADSAPPCTQTTLSITCPHDTVSLSTGASGQVLRQVHYQVPTGPAPENGFPVAIFFQGSLFSAQGAWSGVVAEVFGIYHQVLTFSRLLDAGYAVLAPETHLQGTTYWDTNLPAWAYNWEDAPDHYFMLSILAAIADGRFGPLDPDRLYAFGFSSGGYMTSRVGVAHPGRFLALAIHSGSWATCAASICSVPDDLPPDHPPVLFLQGLLDATVPEWTMRLYERALAALPVQTRVITSALHGHEWLPDAPDAIVDWFDGHP